MAIRFIDNAEIIQIKDNHGIRLRICKQLFKLGHRRIPVKQTGQSIIFIGINDTAL